MSIFTLERQILNSARELLCNPRLTLRDLREWNTDEQTVRDGALVTEVVVHLPDPGVWLAVLKKNDRRNGHTLTTLTKRKKHA